MLDIKQKTEETTLLRDPQIRIEQNPLCLLNEKTPIGLLARTLKNNNELSIWEKAKLIHQLKNLQLDFHF